MHIPKDTPLAKWIRALYSEGKIYIFYKSPEWIGLRNRILEKDHYECVDCREKGRYTRAKLVHHEREVRDYPELAMSEFFIDEEGQTQRQLVSLCMDCHERRHERAFKGQKSKKWTNTERW